MAKRSGRSGRSMRLLLDVVEVVQPDADDLVRGRIAGSGRRLASGRGLRAPAPSGAVDAACAIARRQSDAVVGGRGRCRASKAVQPRSELEPPVPLELRRRSAARPRRGRRTARSPFCRSRRRRGASDASLRTGWATRPGWPPGWSMAARRLGELGPASRLGEPPATARRRRSAGAGVGRRPGALRLRVLELGLGVEELEDLGRVELVLEQDPTPEQRRDRCLHVLEPGDDRADVAPRDVAHRAVREAT